MLELTGSVPSDHILSWSTREVHHLFCSLSFTKYEPLLIENDITGEVLIHMDHEALRDLGVFSVGQRLAILKLVYNVKIRDDVPIEEHHWSPPIEDMEQTMLESPMSSLSPRVVMEMLGERDERIRMLELEMKRMSDAMSGFRDEMQAISKALYNRETLPDAYGRGNKASRSPITSQFPHPLSNAATAERGSALGRSNSLQHPSATQFFGRLPSPNGTSFIQSEWSSPIPSPSTSPSTPSALSSSLQHQQSTASQLSRAPYTEVLSDHVLRTAPSSGSLASDMTNAGLLGNYPPPFTPSGLPNTASNPATPTRSSPVTTASGGARLNQSSHGLSGLHDSSQGGQRPYTAPNATSPSSILSSLPTASTSSAAVSTQKGGSSNTLDHPYRSFKVTLEDPCYKVLPAALKKYKINDDWRDYALFICYGGGTTERCLSYDEKPLLLFQKLKDAGQNPVFMLRHIRDIKSPILMAAAKHSARREKRAKEGPSANEQEKSKEADKPGPHPQPLPSPASSTIKGYCISIYPYMSEREDELDVNVGDTFVIISKTKGWWIVYREPNEGESKETARAAWVPAGCLLETYLAPLQLSEMASGDDQATRHNAASIPMSPDAIISVSTPGVGLMDYKGNGSDELPLVKGDLVRVYKRYNHWSYTQLNPISVGKLSKSASSNPSSAVPSNAEPSKAAEARIPP